MNRHYSESYEETFPEEYELDQWEIQEMQADTLLHDAPSYDEYEKWQQEFKHE